MYEYHIELSEKDYIDFNKYHLLHSESGKKAIRINQMLFPIISVILLFLIWFFNRDLHLLLIEGIVLGIISVIMFFLTKGMLLKKIEKHITKLKKEGKLPFNQKSILTFDEDGIHEKTANTETKTNYTLIEKIIESDETIYVYIGAVQAIIIPKDCYIADHSIDELLVYLNEKTKLNR